MLLIMDEKSRIQIKSETNTDDMIQTESLSEVQSYDEFFIIIQEIDDVEYELFEDQSSEGVLKSENDCLTPVLESTVGAEEFDSTDNLNPQGPYVSEVKTEPSSFACDTCKNVFLSKADLEVHDLIHADQNRFTCPNCNETFGDEASLNIHTSEHTELPISPLKIKAKKRAREKPYKCEVCDARFTLELTLRRHMLIHTGEKRFVCDMCNIKFFFLRELINHAKSHMDKRRLQERCSDGSATAESFSNSQNRGVQEMSICKYCNNVLPEERRLKEHNPTHTVDKSYDCRVCQCRLMSFQGIQIKSETNTESPSAVQVCDEFGVIRHELDGVEFKLFENQSSEGTSKYNADCSTVGAEEFNSEDNLMPQGSSVGEDQTEPSSFACDTCKNIFSSKADLDVHVLTHADQNHFTCPICNETFADEASLNVHTSEHGEIPIPPQKVEVKKRTGGKPYKCEVCGARFTLEPTLRRHMLIHIGGKGFVCNMCHAKFFSLHDLIDHVCIHMKIEPKQGSSNGSATADPFSNAQNRSVPKIFKCKYCNKVLVGERLFKRHVRIHTAGEALLQCELCVYSCRNEAQLKFHMRIHNRE